jgi:thymidylate synthase ThyX
VTFLLAGIGLETSLELIAHTEARFSRITSSKTKAKNDTLYRLQGLPEDLEWQKIYITEAVEYRKKYESVLRTVTSDSNEFFNILAPGAKCTTISYTMNLKDYHRLFIGRLKKSGNETEVQEVCMIMASMLHEKYPIIIRSPEEYYAMNLEAKNSE